MGLKCSVLGHNYGEATVERERKEQGSEVVITIQELETCERCGQTRIVSENKEVTSIETPADIAGDLVDDEDEATDHDATAESDEAIGPDDSGPSVSDGDDDADGDENEAIADAETEYSMGESERAPADPATEDAEIIDDSDDIESGDAELDEPTTSVNVPDTEATSTSAENEPTEDDGVIIDADDEPAKPERAPGEWPEEPNDDEDDWKPETVLDDNEETPDVEPVGSTAVTVPDGKFHCPECGFSTDVESSSLREGDFCPECHKGSLVQQPEE